MKKHAWFAATLTLGILALAVGCNRDGDVAENEAFCEEHQIAEAQCPWCDPSLLESLGFCAGHGVPEAICYQCNPALVPAFKAIGDWCAPHERPESQCYICNPQLDPNRQAPAPGAPVTSALGEFANLGGGSQDVQKLPRTARPPQVSCAKTSTPIRFESPDIAGQAGLEFATVEARPITQMVQCNAVLKYDGNRHARISSQMPGIVAAVHADIGDSVRAGDPLVTISSSHLAAAKGALLQAAAAVALWERNHAREAELAERGVATERDLLEAETRLAESRIALAQGEQALLAYGLSSEQIAAVRRTSDTDARYEIAATFDGVVVARDATLGEIVAPGTLLLAVADLSLMWAMVDVYESDQRHVKRWQPVVLHVEGLPGIGFAGYISAISAELDPTTRTLQARAEVDNAMGYLRANMFARAEIQVRNQQTSPVVPANAVQWEGCCNVVFVRKSETDFEPRAVHLGLATGTVYEVLSGLAPGETVVTEGSFLLKTEILKGSIGAGCCEVHPES